MVSARLLTRLIDLATLLVLTRLLRPADFGLVAIAMGVVTMLEAVFELPLNQALLRLPVVTRAHYDTAFTLSLLRGLVLSAVLIALSWPFAFVYGDRRLIPLVCLLSLAPVGRGLLSPRLAEFQKQMSFWRDFSIELSGKVVSFAVAVAVAYATRSYWAIALATVTCTTAMAIQSYRLAPYRPRLALGEFATFRDFVGSMSIAQIIGAMNWQFERLLLGKLKPVAQLGLFTTASDLAGIPFAALFVPIMRPLLAAFAQIQDDPDRLSSSYQRATIGIIAIGLPVLVGESLVAEPLVRVILGARWGHAVPFVRWLSLSLAPALFTLPFISLVMATGRIKLFLTRNLVEFGIKLPSLIAGAVLFGFVGVIVSRVVSELAADLFCMVLVRRLIGLSLREQVLGPWRCLVATAAMALAVLVSVRMVPPGSTAGQSALCLTVAVVVGAVTYLVGTVGLWIMTGRPDGLETLVLRTLDRLRRRRLASIHL